MNHAVVTEHLADYLEGDLALDLRALVDAHLDSCELCRSEVREMQQTIRLLRALPEPEHPPMIAANVMRRIRAGETEPSLFERIQRTLGAVLEPSFVLPASAIAVAALVIVVVRGGESLTPAVVASADQAAPATVPTVAPSRPSNPALRPMPSRPVEPSELAAVEPLDRSFGASAAGEVGAETDLPTPDRERATVVAMEPARGTVMGDLSAERLAESAGWTEEDALGDSRWSGALAARDQMGSSSFGDPVLAQGLASDVSGPGVAMPTNRIVQGIGAAVPLSLSRRVRVEPELGGVSDSGGEDPRDVWLARALEHPADFAHYIAKHNLAEQEIWVERLSERAEARGLLGELVTALRGAGDEKATWLADDFAAQAKAAASNDASGGTPDGDSPDGGVPR